MAIHKDCAGTGSGGVILNGCWSRAFPETWGGVTEKLRIKFKEHFETGMEALWALYPNALSELIPGAPSPHLLMQDMARLFMCYSLAPGTGDSYSKFLIELSNAAKRRDTCLATLNYEHLLEIALFKLRLRPRVLRPHGGCQFWIRGGGQLYGSGRALGQGLNAVSSRIRPLSKYETQKHLNRLDQAQYPCMAIYIDGKVTQMGQRYLWRAQQRFTRRVLCSKTVTLVGVRPWPSDTHVWDGIRRTTATVNYVGGEKDFACLHDLRKNGRESRFVSERFDDCIPDVVQLM